MAMLRADQLHQRHGLADAGAAEQADLAALVERADEIDDLDAGLEDLHVGGLIGECRRLAVDGPGICRADGALAVHGLAQHVHDPTQRFLTHRGENGLPGVEHADTAGQAVGRTHGDGAHDAVADLLLHLERQAVVDLERMEHLRHGATGKFHVYHGADDLRDLSGTHLDVLIELRVSWCSPTHTAAAPATISESSCVMDAWRALL